MYSNIVVRRSAATGDEEGELAIASEGSRFTVPLRVVGHE